MANVSRPALGDNSRPRKPGRPAYKSDSTPRVVSRGTVSHPVPLAKWNPSTMVADATPKIVQR